MTSKPFRLAYPRKHLQRYLVRIIGRLIIPLLFQLKIRGRKNFPNQGPLLVVGNHTAAMEAVLLIVFSPWQIEMLSAADTPGEKITDFFADFYGVIPLHRGAYDRAALDSALDILDQGGIVGLFPEGGIWEVGRKKAHTGIAWLSYRSGAPVLPIGFNDTTGAINQGLHLKRPVLTMDIGQPLQAARIPDGMPRKAYFQEYADQVMQTVHQLIPPEDYQAEPEIINEAFEFEVRILDAGGRRVPIPENLAIQESLSLAKFLHRPALLKIFSVNLELPVQPLQTLHDHPNVPALIAAVQAILDYLQNENPYLLSYRFGVQSALAMQSGLCQILDLLQWCQENDYQIEILPTRSYYSLQEGMKIVQTRQGSFRSWM